MKFDFDQRIDRTQSISIKWSPELRQQMYGESDIIPMGIADMDFKTAPAVAEAIQRRAAHETYGYGYPAPEYLQACADWQKRRNHWDVKPEWIVYTPGVNMALVCAIEMYKQPGDNVIIQSPVYYPYYDYVRGTGRNVALNALVNREGYYEINFAELTALAKKPETKLMLLCNPHNPVGRVWTRTELESICALARKYSVTIISDEIHADLEMPGYKVTPILSVEPNAIQLISATKTFNLAALRHSSVLIKNADLRARFKAEYDKRGIDGINLFGALAQRTAYSEGEAWLNELLAYIDGNRRVVEEALDGTVVKYSRLEATYLMWLDMRALNLNQKDLMRFVVEKARLGLNDGTSFGEEGAGFVRLNLATPRKNVVEAMARLTAALKAL